MLRFEWMPTDSEMKSVHSDAPVRCHVYKYHLLFGSQQDWTQVVDARVQLSRFPLWITKLLYMDSIRHSICLQEGDSFASACPSLASECTECDCFYSRPLQWPLCSVSAALMTLSDDFMFCQLILNVRFRRKCRCQGGQSVQ